MCSRSSLHPQQQQPQQLGRCGYESGVWETRIPSLSIVCVRAGSLLPLLDELSGVCWCVCCGDGHERDKEGVGQLL